VAVTCIQKVATSKLGRDANYAVLHALRSPSNLKVLDVSIRWIPILYSAM